MKLYAQDEGIFFCGKVKEIRFLLGSYARRYRTVKELLKSVLN